MTNDLKKPTRAKRYQLIREMPANLERFFFFLWVAETKLTQVHLGPAITKCEVHPDVELKVK